MDKGDHRRALRNWEARRLGDFDRQLQEFRRFYAAKTADQRACFRAWLEGLSRFNEQSVLQGCGSDLRGALGVAVGVAHHDTDASGAVAYTGAAMLSPKALLSALDAWDHGLEFAPASEFDAI